MSVRVEIPKRSLFKAAEVCSIAGVQPYVLRSWEAEFPSLGRSKAHSGPRVYRRADVERVLEIKRLLYEEGLTLGAARRRLEGDRPAETIEEEAPLQELRSQDARERIGEVKKGLRAILKLLSDNGSGGQLFETARIETPEPPPPTPKARVKRARNARAPSAAARRKRRRA